MRISLRLPHPFSAGLPRMVSFSVAAHILLGVAALTLPALLPRPRATPWDTVMVGSLVELPAGGPAAQAAPAAPLPAPQPSAPVPVAAQPPAPTPPPPQPRETRKPPKKTAAASPKPAKKTAAPASGKTDGQAAPAAPAAPTAAAAGASGDSPGVGVSFGGGIDFGYAYYNTQLMNKLRANWVRPIHPPDNPGSLSARVRFVIDRQGRISAVSLEIPSSYPLLDDSAVRAVYQAAPYPPLPPQFTPNTLDLAVTFTLDPASL